MLTPIDNKTRLNTALFTFLSSGAIDVIMVDYPKDKQDYKTPPYRTMKNNQDRWWEWGPSVNYWPPTLDPDKEANIYVGDRETVFLNQLYTNYFFIDLEYLDIGKTVYVNFSTTREHSFSLTRHGNRNPFWNGKTPANGMNLRLLGDAQKWGYGTVRNLEKFFEGYREDKVLDFNFEIHKPNSYTLVVGVGVTDPDPDVFSVTYNYLGPDGMEVAPVFVDNIQQGIVYTIHDWPAYIPHDDYFFNGWSTNRDGTGTILMPGDTILVNNNLTLYPMWTPIQYTTIRYFSGSNSYTLTHRSEDLYTIVNYLDLDFEAPPGATFMEWNTLPDGSGTRYVPGNAVDLSNFSTFYLYAQWAF